MSNQLPTVVDPDDEDRKKKENEVMTGKHALEFIAAELKEKGITLPTDMVWEHAKRNQIEASALGCFALMGGVQGMLLWAVENKGQFYGSLMKLIPAESVIHGAPSVTIHTSVPDSPLNNTEIDVTGRVLTIKQSGPIDEFE